MLIEDSELLAMFQEESKRHKAFSILLKKYQQKIYWHIRRMVIDHDDTDDIVQEVFIKVWKSLDSFRQDSQLYTWIYRIATNECITFLNKKKNHLNISYEELAEKLEDSLNDDNFFSGEAIQKKLQKAILTLPEKQRLVFNMKYYDDLKFQEISDILGTSVGALKTSYHLAVKKIENFLLTSD